MIFNLLFIAFWSAGAYTVFKLIKYMNQNENHHMVDEDIDFHKWRPELYICDDLEEDSEDLEKEKWDDLNADIASGLSINA